MVSPLLFSWAEDMDAPPSVSCRAGTGCRPAGRPHWCQHFHLRRGVQVRRLRVSTAAGPPEQDHVYVIGVEVRPGRGRYRTTSIVTVSPRYQLQNASARTLVFAQRWAACTVRDPGAQFTHVTVPSGCQLAYHWPRLDREQALCVRSEGAQWSGALRVDRPRSLHVALREEHTGELFHFLRLEVVARGATLHAQFTDPPHTVPPPMRVDNRSEVTVMFSQQDVPHMCVARAGQRVPYAWDEPDRPGASPPVLLLTAPGGATASCDMDKLGPVAQLTYENFIYVAFTGE